MQNTIGKCIRTARETCDITQAELANMCGLSKETIASYENGEKTVRKPFLDWVGAERTSKIKKYREFALAFSDALIGKTNFS